MLGYHKLGKLVWSLPWPTQNRPIWFEVSHLDIVLINSFRVWHPYEQCCGHANILLRDNEIGIIVSLKNGSLFCCYSVPRHLNYLESEDWPPIVPLHGNKALDGTFINNWLGLAVFKLYHVPIGAARSATKAAAVDSSYRSDSVMASKRSPPRTNSRIK